MLTFTILTMDAEPAIQPLRDRQPVILADGAADGWITSGSMGLPSDLGTNVQIWPVTPRMNSPRYDAPDCIEPVAATEN
jgi:putative SOS response-associated peptidase YedK